MAVSVHPFLNLIDNGEDGPMKMMSLCLMASIEAVLLSIPKVANLCCFYYFQDVIILGDLNADCSYASRSDLSALAIYNQHLFFWPIDFGVDTTVSSNTNCAYDRYHCI